MKRQKKKELLELFYVGCLTLLACLLVVPSLQVSATVDKRDTYRQPARKTVKATIETWFQHQLAITNKQVQKMVNQGKKADRIEALVARSRTHMEKVSEQWRKQLERYTERLHRRLEQARDHAKRRADRLKKEQQGKKSAKETGPKAAKSDQGQNVKAAKMKVEPLPLRRAFARIERDARAQFRVYLKTKKPHEGIERAHNEVKQRVHHKIEAIRKTIHASLKRSKRGLDLTLRTMREAIKRSQK